ncbi:hypothetical protein NXC12_CH01837 [Rhizobium etli]|uniref:Uncharacterized protein n=1 Tax=Rhizobium etli TaxID=29449 RepID=A0AAN1BF58_RHIET|nr:hypothetical protein NXC12_CH01837 [Rhizobium etli]
MLAPKMHLSSDNSPLCTIYMHVQRKYEGDAGDQDRTHITGADGLPLKLGRFDQRRGRLWLHRWRVCPLLDGEHCRTLEATSVWSAICPTPDIRHSPPPQRNRMPHPEYRLRMPSLFVSTEVPRGRGGIGRHKGLKEKLSARAETPDVELLKVGETCQMAIPSQAPQGKV